MVIQSVGGGTKDGDKSPVITVATDSISKGELLNQQVHLLIAYITILML